MAIFTYTQVNITLIWLYLPNEQIQSCSMNTLWLHWARLSKVHVKIIENSKKTHWNFVENSLKIQWNFIEFLGLPYMVIKLPYMVIFPEFGLIFDEISVKFQWKAQKTLHKLITRLQSNHTTIDYNQL